MKKLIVALIALTALTSFAGEVIREVDLTATGTGTNTATYTCGSGRIAYPLGLYQSVTTQTNAVVLTQTMGSATTAVTVETLGSVTNTVAYETVGAGDVSSDVDDIIVKGGETLTITGTGADASNVVYVLRVKEVTQ